MNKYIKPPKVARLVSGSEVVWDIPTTEKKIYLTFDDGPIPELTPKILDILAQYQIKATFFCVGDNIHKNPDILKKVLAQGHHVGNHTYNHLNGWKTPLKEYLKNVKRFNSQYHTTLLRPPYGKITPMQIHKLSPSYRIVMWSLLTYDFDKNIDGETCLQLATENLYNGCIVVFHDNVKAAERVLYALPRFLDHCLSNGYTFHLIADDITPPSNLKSIFDRKLIELLYR